jgi:uncharacterized membrane protein
MLLTKSSTDSCPAVLDLSGETVSGQSHAWHRRDDRGGARRGIVGEGLGKVVVVVVVVVFVVVFVVVVVSVPVHLPRVQGLG